MAVAEFVQRIVHGQRLADELPQAAPACWLGENLDKSFT